MASSLSSFVQILEQDHYHSIIDHIQPQIQALLEKARFLRDLFVENSSPVTRRDMEALDSRIRDATHKAEDLVESYIRDKVHSSAHVDVVLQLDLKDVMEEFYFVKGDLLKIVGDGHLRADLLPPSLLSLSGWHDPSLRKRDPRSKNIVVGLESDTRKLMELIFERTPRLKTVPLAGMGGVGKTTLAQILYNDELIVSKFRVRVWVTISQEFNEKATLLALLDGLGKLTNEMYREKYEQLGEHVRDTLRGRKYFIVLDDVWDLEAHRKIVSFFPDDSVGSRVLLTTRIDFLAKSSNPSRFLYYVGFRNLDESWSILCQDVFGEEHCPPEFRTIGKRILDTCHGHPLKLKLVAGFLSTSKMTPEFWELVAENLPQPQATYESISDILDMSYNHLPFHLTPCLLYMGAFPEDYVIRASKIIKLWIVEGFIKPLAGPGTSLEDTAVACLKALVDRNLLSVCEQEPNGRIKTFKMHDIVRGFCQKKGMEENLLWYKDLNGANVPDNEKTIRRVGAPALSQESYELKSEVARTFLCIGRAPLRLVEMFFGLSLLRVLDVFGLEFYQFPVEILQLVMLRYLSFSCHSNLSNSISRLQNLQTLIIRRLPSIRVFSLPPELWELTQLRHVKSKETCIWYFPADGNYAIQGQLETLSNVQMIGVTNEFIGNIPNIKKLGLFCNIAMQNVIDLASLRKLEKLKCSSDWSLVTHDFLSFLTFPSSLKNLTLRYCKIPLGFMAIIGALPNLEHFKLQKSDFVGMNLRPTEPEWEPAEGEFPNLTLLRMESLNLVHWRAKRIHFPKLQHLIIRRCWSITSISMDLGNIPTLELIEVDKFSPSLMVSAKRIQEEQNDRGNKCLEVRITGT